jgi:conjugal transfer pilus assembly protein TraA
VNSTSSLTFTVLPSRKTFVVLSIVLAIAMVFMATVHAGTTGLEFKETFDLLVGWAKGYLGKIFAVAAFLIGCGFSAARQNPMPAIFGLVLALIIGFGPNLIDSILTATI